MINKNDEYILGVALASERIASEVNVRLIEASADAAAAAAILSIISDSAKERKEIREYLTIALTSRSIASEVADQLEAVVDCLGFQAADDEANNAALSSAQAKIKSLSKEARERLVIACANRSMASRLADAIDASGQVAAGIEAVVVIP